MSFVVMAKNNIKILIGVIMDRKEKILGFISSAEYIPMKADEIAVMLDVPKDDYDEFYSILNELSYEGKIYETKRGKYTAVDNQSDMVAGVLRCNFTKGFGFVSCADENQRDIFIPSDKLNNAYDRDRVLVRIDKQGTADSKQEGHIIRILERGNKQLAGVLRCVKGKYEVIPDRREFFACVQVTKDDIMNAKIGDRVLVSIDDYNSRNKPMGRILEVFGSAESVLGALNSLISEKSLPTVFSKPVMNEAESLPDFVSEDEISGREDFRDKIIFTIDGDDSRDFDDAVSLEKADNGNLMLGVHIADVTHYVKEDSFLDKEAFIRGTSVYFPHTVIPMLPQKLSNGICSLNPDVDRLTLSVLIELNNNGNVMGHKMVKSVIHSKARMTYNDVNKILSGDVILREKYRDISLILDEMNELSKKLIKKREDRGAIDFNFPETKVICDSEANPIEVQFEERGDSHKLIESFMLLANETVAEAAFWAELPFVYRVHEAPSNEKLTEFNELIKNFGYSIKGKIDSETIHPKALQQIIEKVKGTPEEMMLSKSMLRSLMKACYRDKNDGHFGLAARYYCHFTSPIRRYPDLMIHRVLKEFIAGTLTDEKIAHYAKCALNAAEQSSEREVEAETAERDAVELLKTAYMREFLGESFDAVISSVTSFGIFAVLENSCEGLIRYETMNNDYFEYNENDRCAYGQRTGVIYKIGGNIRITVVGADILSRRVDFVREADNRPHIVKRIKRRTRPHNPHDGKRKKRRHYER